MKKSLAFFCVLTSLSCTSFSQTKSAKLKFDKDLNHQLFKFLPIGVRGGPSKTYINSILVESNDSSAHYQYISNADIFEIKNRHLGFDTCRSYFSNDTIMIEFGSISPLETDKIILKIKKNKYWAYLVNEEVNVRIAGNPKSLIFKDKVKKRSQEIFGELITEFHSKETNKTYLFYGPFRCIVE